MDRLECDRMFVAVMDAGSFSGAAERLGVSSGQASKLVSKLESDLGVQLLKRTTRALSATEVGKAYYDRIKALLVEFDSLDASIRNASGAPAGLIRITAPISFGSIKLMPALLDFAEEFPDIHLDVSFNDRVVNLVDEGFDLAIRIGNPSDTSLIARRLCDAHILLVASPDYIRAHGEPQSPSDLQNHRCIIDANFRDALHWNFSDQLSGEKIAIPISGRLRFSNGDACLQAALRSMGIAYLPDFIAEPQILNGNIKPLMVQHETDPMGVFAIYPPARHLALKVRSLIDFLARRFHQRPNQNL